MLQRVIGVLCALVVGVACGGGGGGGKADDSGGSNGQDVLDPDKAFFLAAVHVARVVLGPDGQPDPTRPLVNPASLMPVDGLTGLPLPDQLVPLTADIDLDTLAVIALSEQLDALTPATPVVPRDAGLVLSFTRALDASHLAAWSAAFDGVGPAPAGTPPLEVVDAAGLVQPLRVLADPTDARRLVLLGDTASTPGWEATPLVFDSLGLAVHPPGGHLRLTLHELRAADGTPFVARSDLLASAAKPFAFDPGNAALDAVVLQTDTTTVHFNGFLPDLTPPRLVRAVRSQGQIAALGPGAIVDGDPGVLPSGLANGGLGEWAGALLEIVTPLVGGEPLLSRHRVAYHTDDGHSVRYHLAADELLDPRVSVGDAFTLLRSEAFEPIALVPGLSAGALAPLTVDPLGRPRDPFDPQDLRNHDLRYFVRVYDEAGVERLDRWNPSTATFLPLPPRSVLELSFDEPMDPSSFRPYETLSVSDGALPRGDPGWQDMRVGRVQLSHDWLRARFEPVLEDQADPAASRFVGFGGTAARHRLVIRSLPDPLLLADMLEVIGPAAAAALVDLGAWGVHGIHDRAGRGLGLPAAMLDAGEAESVLTSPHSPGFGALSPAVDFVLPFETLPSADPDHGVVVHRFMGSAVTGLIVYPSGSVHDAVTAGVEYADLPPLDDDGDGAPERRFLYGPTTLEIGLNAPGRLTGAPAAVFEHVVDDFNAPEPSPFASPNGEDFLLSFDAGSRMPLNSAYGARMQHVYRAGSASPSQYEFRDVLLDLVGLAWAPRGTLTDTGLEDFQLLVGLSGVNGGKGPSTAQVNGNPAGNAASSGLKRQFDCNLLEWRDACSGLGAINSAKLLAALPNQAPQTTLVKAGTPYLMQSSRLFTPAEAAPQIGFHRYLDFPTFNAGIDPVFGRQDVYAFPYDSNFPMLIEYRVGPNSVVPASNQFLLSPGILSSNLPRFRVWSQGQDPLAGGVPNWTRGSADINDFWAGEGGPLVDPGRQKLAIKPPQVNNGMPTIGVSPAGYVLPPGDQPEQDRQRGTLDGTSGCITAFPTINSDPHTNFYFANGMLQEPLPNTTPYPGPLGFPPTQWVGYGVPVAAAGCALPTTLAGANTAGVNGNEPNFAPSPDDYGDNSRYFMLWKYRKRVSRIESPTLLATSGPGGVRWLRPVVEPPPSSVAADADQLVELRAGETLDFAVDTPDTGYIDALASDFAERVAAGGKHASWVKFRASFGVAAGKLSPPAIDTIALPYEKLK